MITWLHKEPGHQQPWHCPPSPRIFRPQHRRANTLRPEPNNRHFTDEIFKCNFLIMCHVFIGISLKFGSKDSIASNDWVSNKRQAISWINVINCTEVYALSNITELKHRSSMVNLMTVSGIILYMRPANERRRYVDMHACMCLCANAYVHVYMNIYMSIVILVYICVYFYLVIFFTSIYRSNLTSVVIYNIWQLSWFISYKLYPLISFTNYLLKIALILKYIWGVLPYCIYFT